MGSLATVLARKAEPANVVKLPTQPTVASLFKDAAMGCMFLRADQPSDFEFRCGKPTKPGQPWCDHHREIVWQPVGRAWTESSIKRAASFFGRQ